MLCQEAGAASTYGRGAGRSGLGEHLRALGLGPDATALYLALLNADPAPLDSLADRVGFGGERLETACRVLAETGLVAARFGDDDPVSPAPPGSGLEILARSRSADLERARVAVSSAFDCYRRRRPTGDPSADVVEVVSGDAIEVRIRQAVAGARREVRWLDTPPYFRSSTRGTAEGEALLNRGVRYRTVYSRASLEHPGNFADHIDPCRAAGEEARLLESVPVKLTLVDDDVALLGMSLAEADVNHSLLVVRPCGLLSALSALFALCWDAALPLQPSGKGVPHRLRPCERQILVMLAAGAADTQIVRELGISRRTFFRRMELLMARAGVSTRFQLAIEAQRRSWL
ncbi:LuxR family transcriptional regulator [Streptomyces sp. KR80]|uniref:LuxR family transcriptional regulator n=1 Tax=Streptomyces sp. KR80 TaxID=3457426 RepID=UPI003FCF49BE